MTHFVKLQLMLVDSHYKVTIWHDFVSESYVQKKTFVFELQLVFIAKLKMKIFWGHLEEIVDGHYVKFAILVKILDLQ